MSAPIVDILARSAKTCLVEAASSETSTSLWFQSAPIDRKFCYRAVQLQLETVSTDQGHDPLEETGSWSWFEVAIYKDSKSTEPAVKNGRPLVWRSHNNRTDSQDTRAADSLHFGTIFDRRHKLFDVLEVGNVIGVRVCAKNVGWINDARIGRLRAKYVHYDLFSPMSWSVSETHEEDAQETVKDGVYTLNPTSEVQIISASDEQTDAIWFTTPILDELTIPKLQDIQLFTVAYHQGQSKEGITGVWSWFDIVVLDTPDSTVPKTKNNISLVWRSHNVPFGHHDHTEQAGNLFESNHEIFSHLEPGNAIGVRLCTRFVGWELWARSARLVVRVSNMGPRAPPTKAPFDWTSIVESNKDLQKALEDYLENATPSKKPAALSVETTLLTQELRSDRSYGQGGRPLRLLSLDGGGVRGISSLHILKDVMHKVAGDPNAKPCDYFDMMAGTSTGGLIAIMLGRLRMSIDEVIAAYIDMAGKIFAGGPLSKIGEAADTGARYSGDALKDAVQEIIARYTPNKDPRAPMLDDQDGCKVFVLACRADDLSNSVATHLRTYSNRNVEKSFHNYEIWEAARATSAAPTYFPRIKLGDHEYIDGGVGFNNPILLLMGEARLHFGFARPIGCLVTIGTGMNPNVVLPGVSSNAVGNIITTAGTLKSMWELVTTSEHANIMAKGLVDADLYFRFNLGKKLAEQRWIEKVSPTIWERIFGKGETVVEHYTPENWAQVAIALDSYKEMGSFVELTNKYMEGEEEQLKSKNAAAKLPPKRSAVTS